MSRNSTCDWSRKSRARGFRPWKVRAWIAAILVVAFASVWIREREVGRLYFGVRSHFGNMYRALQAYDRQHGHLPPTTAPSAEQHPISWRIEVAAYYAVFDSRFAEVHATNETKRTGITRRPCICCAVGGSGPLLQYPAEAGRAGTVPRLGWTGKRGHRKKGAGVFFAACASCSSRHGHWLRNSRIRAAICWPMSCEPAGVKCRLAKACRFSRSAITRP